MKRTPELGPLQIGASRPSAGGRLPSHLRNGPREGGLRAG